MSDGYDPAQRRAAAAIQRANPAWLIMYGPWSRMYFAFPLFRAPPGAMLAAPAPAELLAAMRRAELAQHHGHDPHDGKAAP